MTDFLLAYIALVGTATLAVLVYHNNRTVLPKIFIQGKEMPDWRKDPDRAVRVTNDDRKGAVIMPDSEVDQERGRIIRDRAEQGLDTPVEMLRDDEPTYEED